MKKLALLLTTILGLSTSALHREPEAFYYQPILDYIQKNYEWSFSGEPDFSAGFFVKEETLLTEMMDIHEDLASVVAEVKMEEWFDGPGWEEGSVSCNFELYQGKIVFAECECEGECENPYPLN